MISMKSRRELEQRSNQWHGLLIWEKIAEWCPENHTVIAIIPRFTDESLVVRLDNAQDLDRVVGERGLRIWATDLEK
jgi:hypothetical protein